jgi:hypothetical protein
MPMKPTRRHKQITKDAPPTLTVADYFRMRLSSPDNTAPVSHEDFRDHLRQAIAT